MPEIHPTQRDEGWHAARAGKITASLAAACLGLDPYVSRQKAWRAITSQRTEAEESANVNNPHVDRGVRFEASARVDYEVDTGNLVVCTGFWVHDLIPWLGASPDGLIDDDGLCEIKCPFPPTTKVPVHHRIQMLVQMAVCNRTWCDYYAWCAYGHKFHERVHRQGIPGLIHRLEQFYQTYVVPGVCPERKKPKRRKKVTA